MSDPDQALKVALRRLASRHRHLTTEIKDADAELRSLVATAAPAMTDLLGVGVEVAGQLLTTVRDNPQRMRSEAAFAICVGWLRSRPAAARLAGTGLTAEGSRRQQRVGAELVIHGGAIFGLLA